MKTRFMGDSALLVETSDAAEAQALRRLLLRRSLVGLKELVPGQTSLLLIADPEVLDLEALAADIPNVGLTAAAIVPRSHEFMVNYHGEDLRLVAAELNLEVIEVVRRHTAPLYTVAFLGFTPGFAYLTGLDSALRLPRRADPRLRVPAGTVAIADEFTAIYPQATPGGWHLLGSCEAVLFDAARNPPTLLSPGDRVRFTAAP